MLSYLVVGANDVAHSARFYAAILLPIGYERIEEGTYAAFALKDAVDKENGPGTIRDFSHKEKDILSFSGIDAQPGTTDNDGFKFIGTQKFWGKPGELRYEIDKHETIVFGNLDHDKQPEFEVHLHGRIHLQNSDFDL
jgi:serralysin